MKTVFFFCFCLGAQLASAQYFTVADSANYHPDFLEDLAELTPMMGQMHLQDGIVIIEEIDTVSIPETPAIGEVYVFEGASAGMQLHLEVERFSYTSLRYTIRLEKGDKQHEQSGEAHISGSFLMGSESDESSFSGISYFPTEFHGGEGDCYISLRLGHEEETGPELLAKVIKSCNGDLPDINLDTFPTMKADKE